MTAKHGYLRLLTADVPRFAADECEKISRAMHDSQNQGLVILQEIDDTVASEDHFSKVGAVELWNDSTNLGCLKKRIGRFDDTINERDRVQNGVTGDKGFDVLKIVPDSQRLTGLRHRAILSFSS
jgi:hypothetical protein